MDIKMEAIDQKPDISTFTQFLCDAQIDPGQQQTKTPPISSRPCTAQTMQPVDIDLDVMKKEYLGTSSNNVDTCRPIKREPVVILERLVLTGSPSTNYTVNVRGASQRLTAKKVTDGQTSLPTSAEHLASGLIRNMLKKERVEDPDVEEPDDGPILGVLGKAKHPATAIGDDDDPRPSTPGIVSAHRDQVTSIGGSEDNTDGRIDVENNAITRSPGRQHLSRSTKSKKVTYKNSEDDEAVSSSSEEEYDVSADDSWSEKDGIQPIMHRKPRNKEANCVKPRRIEFKKGVRQALGSAVQPWEANGGFASTSTDPIDLKGESEFSCEECSFTTTDWVNMKLHTCDKPQHSLELQRFGCLTCGASFLYAKMLEEHMRKFEGHKPKHQCSSCLVFYTNSISLQIHIQRHHGKDKLFRCNECSFSSMHASALRRHLVRHKAARDKPCPICGKLYQAPNLRDHVKRAHDPLKRPQDSSRKGKSYTCSTCEMKFVYHKDMKAHMNMYADHKAKHQCTLCDKIFCEPGEFRRHEEMHTKGKPHKCKHCDYSSEKMFGLKRHVLRNHTPGYKEIRENYSCLTCAAKFHHISVLKEHLTTTEGHRPEHQCTICNRICRGLGLLKKHLEIHKEIHKVGKPHKCKHCSYSSEKMFGLKRHVLRNHTPGYKEIRANYSCLTCAAKFEHISLMKEHLAAYEGHSPEHQCTICNRSFRGPGPLKKHLEIHKNGKPYKCEQCNYSAEACSTLRKHVKNMHERERRLVSDETHSLYGVTQQPYGYTTCSAKFSHFHMMNDHLEGLTDHMAENQCNLCQKVLQGPSQLQRHIGMHGKIAPFRSGKRHSLYGPYGCKTCSAKFSHFHMVKEHLEANPDHKPKNQCHLCQKVLLGPMQLRRHMEMHDKTTPFRCEPCGFCSEFPNSYDYHLKSAKHMAMVHGTELAPETDISCSIYTCDEQFSSKIDLRRHMKTAHGAQGPQEAPSSCLCNVCGKVLSSISSLMEHMAVHSEEKPYACSTCGTRCKTQSRLLQHRKKVHMQRHKKTRTPSWFCTTCGAKFLYSPDLAEHLEANKDHVPKHQCKLCPRFFERETLLQRHIQVHLSGKPFKCDQCDFSTEGAQRLRNHIASHSSVYDKPCPKCGKLFTSKKYVLRHVIRVHMNVLPTFLCTLCGKILKCKTAYRSHLATMHSDERPHECKTCGKTFKARGNLLQHVKIHGPKDVRFKCEICDKGFSTREKLKTHMLCHSDDMPYQCKHCGKKFKRPNNLSSHERTHIQQWNFKCDICGQAFKWAHILRNHIKRHEVNTECAE